MNKKTKEIVVNQITFTLKIFSIVFGFTLLTGVFCYFAELNGILGYKIVLMSAMFGCAWGVYATLKRMEIL